MAREYPTYPPIEPYASGMLDVGDGHRLYWETCGNPDGKPTVLLHGGPGSGCGPGWRRFFDPAVYRMVLFDQRNSNRSTPKAWEPEVDLSANTTHHLVADVERLRERLGIERWLVFGASWGTTLGLAYAQRHPERVTELVLWAVATTTRREVEWITRDMGRVFPQQWDRFVGHLPPGKRDGNLAAAYSELLHDPDPAVRNAAALAWCEWEDTHVSLAPGAEPWLAMQEPECRLGFARLVTHYWKNGGFLEEGELVANAGKLAGIPGVLIAGQYDVSGPPDIAWELSKRWPEAEFVLMGEAGHGVGMIERVVQATDAFGRRP